MKKPCPEKAMSCKSHPVFAAISSIFRIVPGTPYHAPTRERAFVITLQMKFPHPYQVYNII
jgi:hypothetical protein